MKGPWGRPPSARAGVWDLRRTASGVLGFALAIHSPLRARRFTKEILTSGGPHAFAVKTRASGSIYNREILWRRNLALWSCRRNQAEPCSADGRGARPYTSRFLALLGMTKCLAGSRTEGVLN